MATRVIVGLTLLAAILALVPAANPGGAMGILLVLLGLAYAYVAIDAEDASAYLIVVLAVGAAAGADVLSAIPTVGMYLDGILDGLSTALYASVATIAALRIVNRLKG
ncbi:MAG: hypothetical protein F4X11_07300 [Acidobacteria bacterium]|nr:hypothetical protein [Chloroflexota bacterium]MYN64816.1 hypothetical protein [Acidobacteriota bacterium]